MRAPCLAAVTLLAAATPPGERGAFSDPLDVPALESRLAPGGCLAAVVEAGGRLVAVGQRGHVLTSDDGGATWAQASVPVSTDLTAVHFPSPRRGWAVGHDGVVLATADGGRSWEKQLDGRRLGAILAARARAGGDPPELRERLAILASRGTGQSFLDVWFADERTGFAVGAFDLLVHTEDGGRTWTPWLGRTENPRSLHLHAVRRVAGEIWIAGEQGLALKLDPVARRFRAVRVGYAGSFFGVTGVGRAVVLHGLRGSVFRSADGGATWRRVPTGLASGLTASTALPDGRLVIVSQTGHVLVSGDGGASFAPARPERLRPASAAAPSGPGALAIVGADGARVERLR